MRSRPRGSRWGSGSGFLIDWCPSTRRSKWRPRRRQGISPLREPRMEPSCAERKAVPSTHEATAGAAVLLSAAAVRGRCAIVSEAARRGETRHFRLLWAMQAGIFSADPSNPWRADAAALSQITPESLARAFQHAAGNELVGLEGRVFLLRRLGGGGAASPPLF